MPRGFATGQERHVKFMNKLAFPHQFRLVAKSPGFLQLASQGHTDPDDERVTDASTASPDWSTLAPRRSLKRGNLP